MPRQRLAVSAVGVYLSWGGLPQQGWLRQQWACISVGAGCFGSGGRPSPTERLGPSARDSLKSRFCSSHWVSQTICSCNPLGWPTVRTRSVSSPALSSLRLPVQQGTRTSTPCGDCWVGPAAAAPDAGFARQTYCLASRIFFILGSFPVLWATTISLEMQL